MPFRSTKTYGHDVGLSATFRQWKAASHCNKLHGYALSVGFVFEASDVDARHWVVDFGSLKEVKAWLADNFDHKTLVARDDPERLLFEAMVAGGIADVVWVDAVGCEAFAEMIYRWTTRWMVSKQMGGARGSGGRVELVSVEVREHGANSAIYLG
jgi:6-pyruvoyltetrahydropterin/6-carboxytetrahydropterin synthase